MKKRHSSINLDTYSKLKSIQETPPRHIINSSKNSSTNIIASINKDNHNSNSSIRINRNSKRTFSKAISINISSVQSSEHKATYEIEEEKELRITKKGIKEVIDHLESGSETSLKIKFMKDKYKDKYDRLIELLISCDNQMEVVNDVFAIIGVVGEDYMIAQRFLKFVVSAVKTSGVL